MQHETCDCCGKFDRVSLFFFENGDMPKYVCNNCPSPDESLLMAKKNYPNTFEVEAFKDKRAVAAWLGDALLYYLTLDNNGNVFLDNSSVTEYCHLMPDEVSNAILEVI